MFLTVVVEYGFYGDAKTIYFNTADEFNYRGLLKRVILNIAGASKEWKAEPGDFNLWVGPNSAEGMAASFVLK